MAVREQAPTNVGRKEAVSSELSAEAMRGTLEAVNAASPFNASGGMEIGAVTPGAVTLACAGAPGLLKPRWRAARGRAGGADRHRVRLRGRTGAGPVVTAQMSLSFLGPARGHRFEACARVIKAGRSQVFAEADLFAFGEGGEERLVATGTAVLVTIPFLEASKPYGAREQAVSAL